MPHEPTKARALLTIRWRCKDLNSKPAIGHWVRRFKGKHAFEILSVKELRGLAPRGFNVALTCQRRWTRDIPKGATVHMPAATAGEVSFLDTLYAQWEASDGPDTYPEGPKL